MKNLKKILSLVLALAMALSLMTVAFAKDTGDFADGDDVTYAEAVDVMATVGVFNGVGDGSNFDPKGTLTREQAAKIITYMIMGQAQADKLVATIAPFADVSADRWSAGAIAYCASEGIMNGTGNGKFNPTGELTGLQFSKMLLVALGYDAEIEEMTGAAWGLATSKLAYAVELDDGMDDINLTDVMTREQAAQMALTTMKTPLVEYPDKGTTIKVNGAVVEFGAQKAQYVVSTIAREQTISDVQLTNEHGYTVEFGEKYCQKLVLTKDTNDFGAPAYTWSYDKKEINTYEDDSDLVAEFTAKVTGKDLYSAITKNVMENTRYFTVYIDGENRDDSTNGNTAVFDWEYLDKNRNNSSDAVGATEKGVLTQVFVKNVDDKGTTQYDVTVVIKNTYLAIASEDYDTKNEDVGLDVYALRNQGSAKDPNYIKDRTGTTDATAKTAVTVKAEDIDVTKVEEDEIYLVTVAQGKVQEMMIPEVVSDASIDSFKKQKDVTVEGTTYQYAHTAKYDVEVLDDYNQTNLKDITYNVILDPYGYLIGIEQNEDPDQYVFLTGMDGNTSDLATKNADANLIFLDGTMETVTVNVDKSKFLSGTENGPQMNTWCTYSVDNKNVYTLKEVAITEPDGWKVAQKAEDLDDIGNDDVKIDKKNVSLPAVTGNAYGNDDTVYLNVTTKAIKAATVDDPDNPWTMIINEVDSVTVGARNASLVVKDQTEAGTDGSKAKPFAITEEIYTLYNKDGYIIAAVTIGEDDGVNKVYAYVHTKTGADGINRESYSKTDDKWTWTREVIVDGKITELKEVGGGTDLSDLKDMERGAWYEIKMDADGNVTKATKLVIADYNATTNPQWIDDVADVEDAVNGKDTVILQVTGMDKANNDELTHKSGTLFTDKFQSDKLGFSVSPEVKTVLCLSDGEGGLYDDVDDRYTARSGLEQAIRELDSNFTGELNVIFDKGDAVVIILVDTTEGEDDGKKPTPAGIYDIDIDNPTAVTVLVDKDATAAQKDEYAVLDEIVKAIEAKGFTVADGAATKSGDDWTIKAVKGAAAVDFVWDTNTGFDVAAITVTVGSDSKLMGAAKTIADLGAGEYAKVSGSTSANNGFKAKTTTLVDGATYDIGYYQIMPAADVAEADAVVLTTSTGKYSYTTAVGAGTIEKDAGDSNFYGKTGATLTMTFKLKEALSDKKDTITVTAGDMTVSGTAVFTPSDAAGATKTVTLTVKSANQNTITVGAATEATP